MRFWESAKTLRTATLRRLTRNWHFNYILTRIKRQVLPKLLKVHQDGERELEIAYCKYICICDKKSVLLAIGNAVAILTDTEKRKQYDMYGPEEERMHNTHSRQGHTHYNYTRGFEGKRIKRGGNVCRYISLCIKM